MDPEKTEPGQQVQSAPDEVVDKLAGLMQNPKISKYLGNATKVVAFCAVSGCILLVIAIMAVCNLLSSITSQIHP